MVVLAGDMNGHVASSNVSYEHTKKLMNEENEWNHRISAGVKEGPADCIRIDEVAATLKNSPDRGLRSSPDLDPDLG